MVIEAWTGGREGESGTRDELINLPTFVIPIVFFPFTSSSYVQWNIRKMDKFMGEGDSERRKGGGRKEEKLCNR